MNSFEKKIPEVSSEAKKFFSLLNTLPDVDRWKTNNFITMAGQMDIADESLIKFLNTTEASKVSLSNYQSYFESITKSANTFGAKIKSVGSNLLSFGKTALSFGANMLASYAIVKGIELIGTAIYNVINATEIAIEKGEEARQAISDIGNAYNTKKDTVDNSKDRYIELAVGVDTKTNQNLSLTTEEYTEFLSITNQLAETFPSLVTGYDAQGNALLSLSGNASETSASLEQLLEQERQLADFKVSQNLQTAFDGTIAQIGALQDQIDDLNESIALYNNVKGNISKSDNISGLSDLGFNVTEDTAFIKQFAEYGDMNATEALNVMKQAFVKAAQDTGLEENIGYSTIDSIDFIDGDKMGQQWTASIQGLTQDQMETFKNAYISHLTEMGSDFSEATVDALMLKTQDEKEIQANWNSLVSSLITAMSVYDGYDELNDGIKQAINTGIGNIDPIKEWMDENGNWNQPTNIRAYLREKFLDPITDVLDSDKLSSTEKQTFQDTIDSIFSLDKSELKSAEYQTQLNTYLDSIKDMFSSEEAFDDFALTFGLKVQTEDGKIIDSRESLMNAISKKILKSDDNSVNMESLDELTYEQLVNVKTNYTDSSNGKSLSEIIEEETKDTQKTIESTPSISFASLLSEDAEGNQSQLSKQVDEFQSNVSTIQEALDSLKSGDKVDLTDLTQEFPELVGQTDNLQESLSKLQTDKISEFASTYKSLISDITDPQEIAAASQFFQNLISSIDLSNVDFSDLRQSLFENLFSGNEGDRGSTYSKIGELIDNYADTVEGKEILLKLSVDPNSVNWSDSEWESQIQSSFSKMSQGTSFDSLVKDGSQLSDVISNYTSEMEKLTSAKEQLTKAGGVLDSDQIDDLLTSCPELSKYVNDLEGGIDGLIDTANNDILDDFNRQIEKLRNLGKDADADALQAYADSVISSANKIEEATAKIGGMTFETPQLSEFEEALNTDNEGKTYETLQSALEKAKELYDKGLVGTDDFKKAAALFSPTGAEDAVNFAENYSKATRYITDDATGVKNFLNDLGTKGYASFETMSDGTKQWTYEIEDLQAAADDMGMSFEWFMGMFGRLGDYGFTNDFVGSTEEGISHLKDLYSELATTEEELSELEQNDPGNTTAIEQKAAEVDTLKGRIETAKDALQQLLTVGTEDAESQVKAGKAAIASMQEQLGKLDPKDENYDSIKSIMEDQIQSIADKYHIELDTDVDSSGATQEVADLVTNLQTRIQELQGTDATVDVKANIEGDEQVQNLVSEIAALPPEVQTKIGVSEENVGNVQGILNQLSQNPESINVGVNYEKGEQEKPEKQSTDVDYTLGKQENPIPKTTKVNYELGWQAAPESKTVKVNYDTSGAPKGKASGTLLSYAHVNGTAYNVLNMQPAFANGKVALEHDEKAVVNELGTEGIIRNGQLFAIPGGMHMQALKKGDIILSAKQMETLFSGGDAGRARAYAQGSLSDLGVFVTTSYAGGGGGGGFQGGATGKALSGATKASGGNSIADNAKDTAKAVDDTKESIDWIETAISRIERKIKNLKALAENIYKTFTTRNKNLTSEIKTIRKEIKIQEKGAKRYEKEAKSVGLSSSLRKLVKNGTIDIRKYDENTQKKIQEYQTWYEKILSCKDAVTELKDTITDLYRQKFDNIITKWSNALQNLEHQAERTEAVISNRTDEANERLTIDRATSASRLNISDYQSLVVNKQNQKAQKEAELAELKSNLEWAVKHPKTSGITKGSEGYYEMLADIQDVENEIDNLNGEIIDGANSVAEEYMNIFDNVATDFENKLSLSEHISNVYSNALDLATEQGYMASTKYYEMMSKIEQDNISVMTQELASLKQAMKEGLESGYIKQGSQDWYDMREQINNVSESIDQAALKTEQFANSIRQIGWDRFDYIQDKISLITDEANFLIELMSSSDLFNDKGIVNDKGMATFGLHGQNYNVLMEQADDYAEQIIKINAAIANDPSDTKLIERKEELIRLQQESIKSAEDEKQAIKSLVKEGIDKQLDSLNDLIEKYNGALDSQKDLFDYQKNIADQIKNISSLKKQLGIYEGDISEETQAKVQKLKVELEKAQGDLEETQYDHFISDQKKLLDDLYDEYEKVLNERLDDIDALIKGVIDAVNNDASKINETLSGVAASVGYTTSEELKSIWGKDNSIYSVLETYHNGFVGEGGTLTTVVTTLDNICVAVEKLVTDAEKNAENINDKGAVEDKISIANPPQNNQSTTPPTVTSPTTPDKSASTDSSTMQNIISNTQSGAHIAGAATPPEDKIIKIINSGKSHTKTVSDYEAKHHTSLWEYLVKKYGRDTDESIMKKLAKALGIKVSSGLKNSEKPAILKALKKKGYASGTPRVGKDEWNWTNEGWLDGNYETIVRKKDDAILTPTGANDMIYSAFASKNMYDFAQNPRGYVGDLIASIGVPQGINNVRSSVNNTGDTNVVLNLDFPGVKNYSELVYCMQHDSNFEKYIRSISVDLLANKSKNAKYNYRF